MDKIAFALFYFYYYDNDEQSSLLEDIQKHWKNWPKLKEKANQHFPSESELSRDIDRIEAIAEAISALG